MGQRYGSRKVLIRIKCFIGKERGYHKRKPNALTGLSEHLVVTDRIVSLVNYGVAVGVSVAVDVGVGVLVGGAVLVGGTGVLVGLGTTIETVSVEPNAVPC